MDHRAWFGVVIHGWSLGLLSGRKMSRMVDGHAARLVVCLSATGQAPATESRDWKGGREGERETGDD